MSFSDKHTLDIHNIDRNLLQQLFRVPYFSIFENFRYFRIKDCMRGLHGSVQTFLSISQPRKEAFKSFVKVFRFF